MSVKSNIEDINANVFEIRGELEEHFREVQSLRADYCLLEHEISNTTNTELIEMINEIASTEGMLKKMISENLADTAELNQQTNIQIKEKILLQESVLNAASRVTSIEDIVGCVRVGTANKSEKLEVEADFNLLKNQNLENFDENEENKILEQNDEIQ